jgi:hypothetical protein
MTNVAIFPETPDAAGSRYLAISGKRHFVGQTAGQALEGLAEQLNEAEKQTLVVVRHLAPDEFFTREQCRRLEELMNHWRAARDGRMPRYPPMSKASWTRWSKPKFAPLVPEPPHWLTHSLHEPALPARRRASRAPVRILTCAAQQRTLLISACRGASPSRFVSE